MDGGGREFTLSLQGGFGCMIIQDSESSSEDESKSESKLRV